MLHSLGKDFERLPQKAFVVSMEGNENCWNMLMLYRRHVVLYVQDLIGLEIDHCHLFVNDYRSHRMSTYMLKNKPVTLDYSIRRCRNGTRSKKTLMNSKKIHIHARKMCLQLALPSVDSDETSRDIDTEVLHRSSIRTF